MLKSCPHASLLVVHSSCSTKFWKRPLYCTTITVLQLVLNLVTISTTAVVLLKSCSHAFVYIAILLIVFTVRFIARFQTSTTWVLRQPTISESHNLLCVQKTTRIRPPVAYKFYVRNDRGWSRGTGYGTARMTADTLDKSPVRTGLRFDSSWDSTVWMTWGTSDDGIFYLFITDYIFKIENIYLCVEQKRFGGCGVHWSSVLMFPLGVGIPRFAHKPCGRQLSTCGLWFS